uniref:Uncharacterized protein n=1 Tax=Anguilla anguilla TaxID=7936 RepID=A0A0E9S6X0_ANGAN
MSALDWNQT